MRRWGSDMSCVWLDTLYNTTSRYKQIPPPITFFPCQTIERTQPLPTQRHRLTSDCTQIIFSSGVGMTGIPFAVPAVQENPETWGPCTLPEHLQDVPFAPFGKGDKIGRASDWTQAAYQKYQGGELCCWRLGMAACTKDLISICPKPRAQSFQVAMATRGQLYSTFLPTKR
jgi:hypothetical protein